QVYCGFDVGSAKPSIEDQREVPHFCLDVVHADEPFDAGLYTQLALRALEQCQAQGRVPILCGGTGLYLRALRWGLVDLPRPEKKQRDALMAREYAEPGWAYRELCRIDPQTAAKTSPANLVYVVRALEIFEATGIPASVHRDRHGFA